MISNRTALRASPLERLMGTLLAALLILGLTFANGPQAFAQSRDQVAPALKFPVVTAYALDKKKLTLPSDFSFPFNLLILTFARDQQDAVDSWLSISVPSGVQRWVLPISGREQVLFRWWLNSSLSSSLPPNEPKRYTVPLFVNQSQFLKSLGISSQKQVAILVTDRSGMILWRAEGTATKENLASLARFLSSSKPAH